MGIVGMDRPQDIWKECAAWNDIDDGNNAAKLRAMLRDEIIAAKKYLSNLKKAYKDLTGERFFKPLSPKELRE